MTKTNTKEKQNSTTKVEGMFIVKVKLNTDNTASIIYRTSTDKEAKEVYYTGKDQVTEEFKKVFQATAQGFCGVIPRLIPDSDKITMNAIKFEYNKTGFLDKALYCVKYAFNEQNKAVVNISTPLLPIYKEGMDNCFTIAGIHEEALHNVIANAKAYINGKTRTKQMKFIVNNEE